MIANGYEVVNPANIGRKFGPEKVDADFLMKGWEDSVGVRLEMKTALHMGFPIVLDKEGVFEKLRKMKAKMEGGKA